MDGGKKEGGGEGTCRVAHHCSSGEAVSLQQAPCGAALPLHHTGALDSRPAGLRATSLRDADRGFPPNRRRVSVGRIPRAAQPPWLPEGSAGDSRR